MNRQNCPPGPEPGQRARTLAFLGRRFAPNEYLGLHLTVGLLLMMAATAAFGLIARDVAGGGALTRFDDRLAAALGQHAAGHQTTAWFFRFATDAGGGSYMSGLAVGLGLGLVLSGRPLLGCVVLFAMTGGGILDGQLKELFQRPRPPNPDPSIHSHTRSFPSGHAMESTVAYGMIAYVLVLHLTRRWARVAAVVGLATLVLAIGFSRLYLRAHYFSDVVAGFAAGAVWLAVCVSGMEVVRRRHLQRGGGSPRPVPGP
jgi:undecaprenyl-diphosphatase